MERGKPGKPGVVAVETATKVTREYAARWEQYAHDLAPATLPNESPVAATSAVVSMIMFVPCLKMEIAYVLNCKTKL